MKDIILAEHAGFCFGVQRAVQGAVKALAESNGRPVYCLGSLIHNKTVNKELEEKGLRRIDSIEEAPDGASVIIRAHGEPDSTYVKAKERGIRLIDLSCPLVAKIHERAKQAESEGRGLIVIGSARHPEVKGILGSSSLSIAACEDPQEAARLASSRPGLPITVVSQTTERRDVFDACCKAVLEVRPDAQVFDTICGATKERQEAAAKLASECDAMVIIGDRESSNSVKLARICENVCKNVIFVESFADLPLQNLQNCNRIGVSASASAPQSIILEVISKMSEEFTKDLNSEVNEMAAYMDEIEKSLKLPGRGEVVTGTVVQVAKDYVVVNLGCKKDGMLPKEEVVMEEGKTLADMFSEGDEVQAKVLKTDDGDGNILLSKKRLQSGENWDEITAAFDSKEAIDVTVVKEVKGGVIAAYKEVSGFIPMSQLADHYIENASEFIGKTLPVKVTRVDQKRNKAVFSHKAFLAEEKYKKISEIWETLNVGDVVEGKVMRFTDYGAFVDIGGIDGLLHISEISWGKLRHPEEALSIGQVINVKILSMNAEKGKISLGLKQNNPEPWSVIDEQYTEGQVITGKVVQIKEYGAFIELAPGLDGLVHISEIAHKRVNKVSDELSIGQEVQAKILEIDKERKRISLSIKACLEAAPAEEAAEAPAEEAPAEEAEAPAEE
ncbi:MAG: bifunctional 4-hydroxy-3-methylbut-2-enyl diphosphate reductase/30S ribosomal protein S1 [Firmicutes bacterium]|nr:bifunctional 4-hydroxy-3-methylbut-2-enyl diphosphate reductase/30S ribosomal protein S1 [Bacillota bacterium]